MQTAIESNKQYIRANKQYFDDKMTKLTEEFKTMLSAITDQMNTFKYSPTQKD